MYSTTGKYDDRDEYRIPISGGDDFFIGIERKNEIFREIIVDGIKTQYLISNQGRVYSKISTTIMTPSVDKSGYLEVAIRPKVTNPVWFRIHRLVMGCFYEGTPSTIQTVNHKNGDKGDNRLENLEYCTTTENNRHFARELKREQKQTGKLIVEKIRKEQQEIFKAFHKQQNSNPRGRNDLSDEEFNEIVALVETYYPTKLICIRFNIKISIIKNIKRGSMKGRGLKELSDDELRLICKDMVDGNYDMKKLAEKHNVRHSVIESLKYKWKKTKHVWKDYFED